MKFLILSICLALMLVICGCTQPVNNPASPQQVAEPPTVTTTAPALANPAAVFCKEKGYDYEIRTNPDGSEYGVCIFPDHRECEEWAYYRGTCNETTGK
jgi:putative hemolysin